MPRRREANTLLSRCMVPLRTGTGRAHHLFADVVDALVNSFQKFSVIALQLPPAGSEQFKRNPIVESGLEGCRILRPRGKIADLTEALNSMSRDDREARVTIALLGDSAEAAGAHMLRRWLVDMGLEIDVLVRTGKEANDFGTKERELIGPSWRCLIQIEKISND